LFSGGDVILNPLSGAKTTFLVGINSIQLAAMFALPQSHIPNPLQIDEGYWLAGKHHILSKIK